MASLVEKLRQFLAELRRRNVYRVAGAYLVAAFVVLQVADMAAGAFKVPGWFEPTVWIFCGLGFPIALVLAWALEVTPEGVQATPEAEESEIEPGASSRRWGLLAGIGTIVVVLGLGGAWWLSSSDLWGSAEDPTGEHVSERSIAVLPFAVTGSGAEGWSEGMVSMLSTGLDGAAGLRAISDRRVFAVWETADTTDQESGDPPALQAARRIGAEYAVIGSAVALAADLQLTAHVYETSSGRSLGQARVRGPADSMMTLADDLTREVLNVLLERSEERIPSVHLASITTESLPAYKAFLRGEQHMRAGDPEEAAIADFRSAIHADSSFALPYLRIGVLGLWHGAAEGSYIQRAYELAEQLPERDRRLAQALYRGRVQGEHGAAAEALRALTADYPDDPALWDALGEFIFHNPIPGGLPEVERTHQRAVELDPGHVAYYDHYVGPAFDLHHDSTRAAERIAAMPASSWKRVFRVAHHLVFGTPDQRRAALARLDTLEIPEPWLITGPLGSPYDWALADTVLRRLLQRSSLPHRQEYQEQLVITHFKRGQYKAGLAERARRRGPPAGAPDGLMRDRTLGIPVPDSVLSRWFEPTQLAEDASLSRLAQSALYAIEEDRPENFRDLLSRIRNADSGAPSDGMHVSHLIAELRGYRAWRQGNVEKATRLMSGFNHAGPWGAIWRGDIYRELGELTRAERWYLAAWGHPLAHERLGRLYEEMGRPAKARAAYERFITGWSEADPALQPLVEQARTRLQALTGEPGRVSAAATGTDGNRGE